MSTDDRDHLAEFEERSRFRHQMYGTPDYVPWRDDPSGTKPPNLRSPDSIIGWHRSHVFGRDIPLRDTRGSRLRRAGWVAVWRLRTRRFRAHQWDKR